MAEIWASTGAVWRDMLLAEALVFPIIFIHRNANTNYVLMTLTFLSHVLPVIKFLSVVRRTNVTGD